MSAADEGKVHMLSISHPTHKAHTPHPHMCTHLHINPPVQGRPRRLTHPHLQFDTKHLQSHAACMESRWARKGKMWQILLLDLTWRAHGV